MASWWGRSHGSRHQSFRTLKTRDMAPLALPARISHHGATGMRGAASMHAYTK